MWMAGTINPCVTDKWIVLCVEWVKPPNINYSNLWVNGRHVCNFQSRSVSGTNKYITIGDRSGVPTGTGTDFKGQIAAIEIYRHGTSWIADNIKRAIMLTLCRQ